MEAKEREKVELFFWKMKLKEFIIFQQQIYSWQVSAFRKVILPIFDRRPRQLATFFCQIDCIQHYKEPFVIFVIFHAGGSQNFSANIWSANKDLKGPPISKIKSWSHIAPIFFTVTRPRHFIARSLLIRLHFSIRHINLRKESKR